MNRRVGANELATIQSCLAFVDAEREYYIRNPGPTPPKQRYPFSHSIPIEAGNGKPSSNCAAPPRYAA
jgi:hypothetical protein